LSNSIIPFNCIQVDLGLAVQRACESQAEPLKFLYPLESSIKEKIESIANFYGASGVEYSEQVLAYILCEFFSSYYVLSANMEPYKGLER
jgi:formyltetrahydrofolate synthetase